ncbi:MAG: type I DNA topoisomerase [Myxococcota bacterium]
MIVESPAKAKTIRQFLGDDFVVEASFGHVRDLPNNASEIPEEVKKEKWSRLGVNPDADFEPLYIVPEDKRKHVTRLKAALKETDRLLLATDEDREGESISWHLLQLLKPPRNMEIGRIVFHEITREAITEAVEHPRTLDESLVRAQESRRILDRLYGYTLSPLLWKKVAPKLSAGRVQSVATRLIVERERQRKAFQTATWWDLAAELGAGAGRFKATLMRQGQNRLASGRSFDPTTGALKEHSHVLLDENAARRLEQSLRQARPWKISKLEHTPGTERPVAPFTTSTLQQEANRKLRFTSKRTMQLAQGLYEGIELGGGERVGLITYMRTDSQTLSEKALSEAREVIADLYGPEYLPAQPVRYRTNTKNAQEAHEAIRPTDLTRRPQDMRSFLDDDQLKLYEMIWKRTIACQMVPAQIRRTNLEVQVQDFFFSASGKQILFPGFLRAYVEGSDDPEAELGDKETLLPLLEQGQAVELLNLAALSHTTRPPARYTEASLVQSLEEDGIGRPSTYASIISTIQDRGYIFKRGNELVPTFTAFCVIEFLENHFPDLVDIGFTSVMEDQLDEISRGQRDAVSYLKSFYLGDQAHTGIIQRVEQESQRLEFPRLFVGTQSTTDQPIVVKMGRFGPYLQRGEGGEGNFASLPDDLPPADLSLNMAVELLERKAQGPDVIAVHPKTGANIVLQKGRFGDYLEMSTEDAEKPQRVSLPQGMTAAELIPEIALQLMSLPRMVGKHPERGLDITTAIGRFGPYVKCGDDFRSVKDWRVACTISLAEALELLAQPKVGRQRASATLPVLREMGTVEGAAGPVKVIDGKYGPYLSDGETNAPLPRGRTPEELTLEEAAQALAEKRGTGKKAGKASKSAKTRKASGKEEAALEQVLGLAETEETSPAERSTLKKKSTRNPAAEAEAETEKATPARVRARGAGKKNASEVAEAAGDTTAAPSVKSSATGEKKAAAEKAEPSKAGEKKAGEKTAQKGSDKKGSDKKGSAKKAPPPPPPPPKVIMVTRKSQAAEAAAEKAAAEKAAAEKAAAEKAANEPPAAPRTAVIRKK